ncbi:MAG: ferrous iron transport protein A [Deltaproteobacteria bacterium]|nr:ferrous iron transport protein A [Deltaproteobacteria bacterium]
MKNLQTLRTLNPGEQAIIKKINISGELGRRIRDMGLVPGSRVQILGRAPLKDPVEVKLMDYNLTLRNNEADFIMVEIKGEQP